MRSLESDGLELVGPESGRLCPACSGLGIPASDGLGKAQVLRFGDLDFRLAFVCRDRETYGGAASVITESTSATLQIRSGAREFGSRKMHGALLGLGSVHAGANSRTRDDLGRRFLPIGFSRQDQIRKRLHLTSGRAQRRLGFVVALQKLTDRFLHLINALRAVHGFWLQACAQPDVRCRRLRI